MVSDMNLNQVTLPSTNIEQSIAFYRGMGFTLIVESPHHARIVEKKMFGGIAFTNGLSNGCMRG